MRHFLVAILAMVFSACHLQEKPQTFEALLESVQGDSLKAHIAYLADDNLKGRLPGTVEYGLAVDYVVDQYKQMGLEPAGENGTYLQEVIVRKGDIDEIESSFSITNPSKLLIPGDDYVFLADLNNPKNQGNGPVEFVGYGISALELEHDDYAEKNVADKIVIIVGGAPKTFASAERAHFSNYGTKFETAMKNGAVGIILSTPGDGFTHIAERYRMRGNAGVVGPDGNVFGRRVFPKNMKFVAIANWKSLDQLFGDDPDKIWEEYKSTGSAGSTFNVSVSTKTSTICSEFSSPNVIGKLPGGDPDLSSEYVVHTAHLDHVGIGKAVEGDSIYNGAHDNASGVASLLEIARLYTGLHEDPRRSILFVTVTAEEMGLLGSDYFMRFPTVNEDLMVANVNTDMPTLIAPLLSIEPIGAEHSSLMDNVREAAGKLDLEIMPDHMPEQVRFVRSDQYNFIRQGIPALHVKYGLKSLDSLNDLSGLIEDYTNNIYHKPSDELNDLFDFQAGEVYVKLNFLISYSIAQQTERPSWNEGDFFGIAKQ